MKVACAASYIKITHMKMKTFKVVAVMKPLKLHDEY